MKVSKPLRSLRIQPLASAIRALGHPFLYMCVCNPQPFFAHSGRKLLPTDFLLIQILVRENLLIPIPIRNYFELISFTDTDSYPPSGIRPQKNTDM